MNSTYQELDVNEVYLDLDNPRIKQFLEIYPNAESLTAEQIAFALHYPGNGDNSTSYNVLKDAIKVQGGLIHPIIVNRDKAGKLVVIEGNTRLQIYKEFNESDIKQAEPTGAWQYIRSIVYDQLSPQEIDSIRLQSHLVGPREWTPYSKAKYLHLLSNIKHLPDNQIISMCGGNRKEISSLIAAYLDFERDYSPLYANGEVPTNDFSKFKELQNKTIKASIYQAGYQLSDFAKWVRDGHVDTALNVRDLPEVLKSAEAKDEFLKTNITEAVKKLAIIQDKDKAIKKYSYDVLGRELAARLDTLEWSEVKNLNDEDCNSNYRTKRNILLRLNDLINEILEDFFNKE